MQSNISQTESNKITDKISCRDCEDDDTDQNNGELLEIVEKPKNDFKLKTFRIKNSKKDCKMFHNKSVNVENKLLKQIT